MISLLKVKDLITSNKKSAYQVKSASTEGSYPFFTSGMKILRTESILTSEENLYVATGGKAFIQYYDGAASYSTDCYSFKVKKDIVEPKYLYYFLHSLTQVINEKMFKGAALKHLQKNDFLNIEVPIFPKVLQQKIVKKIDESFFKIDRASAAAVANSNNATLLTKATVTKLIENLPKDCFIKFGNACDFVRGPFGGSLKKSMFVENGYAVYEQQHAINDQCDSFRYFINEDKFNEMKRFEVLSNDLLMSCSGVTLGKITIVPINAPKGIINQALLKITPKNTIKKEYLKFLMESDYFQSILWNESGGAAQPNVPSVKVIKDFLIPVPSLETQDKLIEEIKVIFDYQLDTVYSNKELLLNELKNSILRQAFNGELIKE